MRYWFQPRHLPYVLFAATLTLVAILVWTNRIRDRQVEALIVKQDLKQIVKDLDLKSTALRDFLVLLGEEITEARLDYESFQARGTRFLESHPEMRKISFIGTGAEVRWAVPANLLIAEEDAIFHAPVKDASLASVEKMEPVFSDIYVSDSGRRALSIYVPVYRLGEFIGNLSGEIHLQALLDYSAGQRMLDRYQVFLVDKNQQSLTKLQFKDDTKVDYAKRLLGEVEVFQKGWRVMLRPYKSPWDVQMVVLGVLCILGIAAMGYTIRQLILDGKRKQSTLKNLIRSRRLARAASQAKTELIANISHEIRTPLGSVQGYLEMLKVSPQQESVVQAMKSNLSALNGIVGDLLDMSKIEAGLLDVENQKFELVPFVSELVDWFAWKAAQKGLEFKLLWQTPVPELLNLDQNRLRQILSNLLENAIKFTPKGHVILSISCDQKQNLSECIFTISDTGIGICESQQNSIFEPFIQADGGISRQYGGSGLGLSIAKKLVTALGGQLQLQRSALQRGSDFTLSFSVPEEAPLIHAPSAHPSRFAAEKQLERQVSLQNRMILIVDDCLDNQRIFENHILSAQGRAQRCSSGEEALLLWRALDPDVILLDIQMPDVDGYETARRLRSAGFHKRILAVTAHAMKGEQQRCIAAGCDDYLTKPVNKYLLTTKVLQHLDVPAEESQSLGAAAESGVVDEKLKQQFIAGLNRRMTLMEGDLKAGKLRSLTQKVHQLRGTAGNYGFARITGAAKVLEETLLVEDELPSVVKNWEALKTICHVTMTKEATA